MGREILFVRVAFAGKDARELVMQNEIVWTVREREEEVEKEKKKTKNREDGKCRTPVGKRWKD